MGLEFTRRITIDQVRLQTEFLTLMPGFKATWYYTGPEVERLEPYAKYASIDSSSRDTEARDTFVRK